MAVKVSIVSKLKPDQLDSIRLGQTMVKINDQIKALDNSFLKASQAISTALDADNENAKGTTISLFLVKDCTTLDDPKGQNAIVIIPPNKESKFKLKAMGKAPGIKNSKQIGLFQIVATGEKEGKTHVFDLFMRAGKFKMTPIFFNKLNKLGAKKNLKFRIPLEEKKEEQIESPTSQEPSLSDNTSFELLNTQIKLAFDKFDKQPNIDLLKACSTELAKLKDLVQNSQEETNFKEIKTAFLNWSNKFKNAKIQLSKQKPSSPKEEKTNGLVAVLETLEKDISSAKNQADLDILLDLLSRCQQIRTNPTYKTQFKTDKNALVRFKQIRKSITDLLDKNQGLKTELEEKLQNPEETKQELRDIAINHWKDFVEDATTIESFSAMVSKSIPALRENLKVFQKQVEKTAKGLIESSKILKLGGDAATISEKMTELRSGIVKLKNELAIQVKQAEKDVLKMSQLEIEFMAANSEEEEKRIKGELSKFAAALNWEEIFKQFKL